MFCTCFTELYSHLPKNTDIIFIMLKLKTLRQKSKTDGVKSFQIQSTYYIYVNVILKL